MPFPEDLVAPGYPTADGTVVQVGQIIANASNLWSGTNPPYAIGGFLGRFPQFGGASVTQAATVTAASAVLTDLSSVTGITAGVLAVGDGIPDGATVLSVDATALTVTLSAQATTSGVAVSVIFYPLLLPLTMLQAYAALANTSVLQGRYKDSLQLCLDLFVAHFATLYMQAALGTTSAKAVIESGRAMGLRTAKSFGDVSASVDFDAVARDLDGWAQWKLTLYGTQFASIARLAAKGGMVVW